MRQGRAWVDTAYLHALGRAHGVDVLSFQEHADEALVGAGMMENAGNGADPPIMAPIAKHLAVINPAWGNFPGPS